MDLLDIFDEETGSLQRRLADLNAFLQSAAAASAPDEQEAKGRIADFIRQELEERGNQLLQAAAHVSAFAARGRQGKGIAWQELQAVWHADKGGKFGKGKQGGKGDFGKGPGYGPYGGW